MSVEELKEYPGFESMTNEQLQEALQFIHSMAELILSKES